MSQGQSQGQSGTCPKCGSPPPYHYFYCGLPERKQEMSDNPCQKQGCTAQAEGVVGVEFYPVKAVMEFYKTTRPLTRAIVGLKVCRPHLEEIVPREFLKQDGMFDHFIEMLEGNSGVTVDKDGCKAVLVSFDDPDYLRMLRPDAANDGEPI